MGGRQAGVHRSGRGTGRGSESCRLTRRAGARPLGTFDASIQKLRTQQQAGLSPSADVVLIQPAQLGLTAHSLGRVRLS